ncbi:hypothetical protein, partial [Mesorhizobium sp. Cs1321R2N1]|uniref:hypothetical protein n=1 Tax=Mesorhizobium sp. Cs1321R2N1 TaxID=3015174 RepID=UPI00301E3995
RACSARESSGTGGSRTTAGSPTARFRSRQGQIATSPNRAVKMLGCLTAVWRAAHHRQANFVRRISPIGAAA